MRLANIGLMSLPAGRLRSYVVAAGPPGDAVPVSFDQRRHVGMGQRPGSWLAVCFRLPASVETDRLAQAWLAVIARHGTLRTVFSSSGYPRGGVPEGEPVGEVALHTIEIGPGEWVEHPAGADVRQGVRSILDEACAPFARPSHRLCLLEPDPAGDDARPVLILGADHAHVDAWSLLVLLRDLTRILDDLTAGRPPGAGLPTAPPFAEHTAALEALPPAPGQIRQRWTEILAAGGGVMPVFPLPLGDLTDPPDEVIELRDILDVDELARLEAAARSRGVGMIAMTVSVLTRLSLEQVGEPLRAVFPVHSRHEPRWHDSVGWFITNAVLESTDPDAQACGVAVKEAIRLGSFPLAPIMAPYGGMPAKAGMFAISWLDNRRLPVPVDLSLQPQHVSAVIRPDGIMLWFVVNNTGLHLRCRYPGHPAGPRIGDRLAGRPVRGPAGLCGVAAVAEAQTLNSPNSSQWSPSICTLRIFGVSWTYCGRSA